MTRLPNKRTLPDRGTAAAQAVRLRFLHVPKTAGTSLNVFLDRFYSPKEIFVFKASEALADSLATLRSFPAEKRRSIRLFRGHAPLAVGDPEIDGMRTFTFLRDPVRRVVSFCHHLAEGKKKSHMLSPPSDCPSGKDFELDAFLSSGEPELENLQTRMLVGEDTYHSLKRSGSGQDLSRALADAFARIEFVGIQESFEEGLMMASLVYGWKWGGSFGKRSNVRRAKVGLNFAPHHIERIRGLNLMDREAHRMAADIYARHRGRLAGKLSLLRLRTALSGILPAFRFGRSRSS